MNICAAFRMFTISEAAEYFGLPKHFIRQLVLTKAIPSIKAGKKYLINEKILETYLQSGAV
ncbi:MAG: excisionase family DNA-binding protein [Oscillospiraceae bacterium]|nr:excisionase family DNA-binding protein [Oscillospiraceae bacterium]